jgi:hypothetical protein
MCGGSPTAVASCSSQLLPDREFETHRLENALIEPVRVSVGGRVHRQWRLGGLLNFYKRAA